MKVPLAASTRRSLFTRQRRHCDLVELKSIHLRMMKEPCKRCQHQLTEYDPSLTRRSLRRIGLPAFIPNHLPIYSHSFNIRDAACAQAAWQRQPSLGQSARRKVTRQRHNLHWRSIPHSHAVLCTSVPPDVHPYKVLESSSSG